MSAYQLEIYYIKNTQLQLTLYKIENAYVILLVTTTNSAQTPMTGHRTNYYVVIRNTHVSYRVKHDLFYLFHGN